MSKTEQRRIYDKLHKRLFYRYGNAPLCVWSDEHYVRKYQWANVSGNYTNNLEDYLPMCPSCHKKFDMTENTKIKMSLSAFIRHSVCKRGHEMKEGNLYTAPKTGIRSCMKCNKLRSIKYKELNYVKNT